MSQTPVVQAGCRDRKLRERELLHGFGWDGSRRSYISQSRTGTRRLHPSQVLVYSTGVLGVPLRIEKILHAVPQLVRSRRASPGAFAEVTRAKWSAPKCGIGGKQVRILGCTKGSGMSQPSMVRMLAFLATDPAIAPGLLSRALRATVGPTFNAITVDGDTSTNDTVAVLANSQSSAKRIASVVADYGKFCAALESVCKSLALAIVADGAGAPARD